MSQPQQLIELPPAPPVGISAIAWHQVAGAGHPISGGVVSVDSLAPVELAVLRISDSTGATVGDMRVSPVGAVSWDAPRSGRYTLLVVRIGYARAQATVTVPENGGVVFTAVLAPQVIYLHQ